MSIVAFTIDVQDKYTHISILEEKFTEKLSSELKAEIAKINTKGIKNIIFDVYSCIYCDSSGISVILVANGICKENKGCLVICSPQPAVSKLIDTSQLSSVLNITPSFNEAVDFIFMDELEKVLSEEEEHLS